jgi:hypothetical protein
VLVISRCAAFSGGTLKFVPAKLGTGIGCCSKLAKAFDDEVGNDMRSRMPSKPHEQSTATATSRGDLGAKTSSFSEGNR